MRRSGGEGGCSGGGGEEDDDCVGDVGDVQEAASGLKPPLGDVVGDFNLASRALASWSRASLRLIKA